MPVETWRVELDRGSEVPLYRQIANLLRAGIEAGREPGAVLGDDVYPPGSAIPAVSRITQWTGCTHVTVRKGVGVLAEEGLVVIVPGKGTFVTRQENGQ